MAILTKDIEFFMDFTLINDGNFSAVPSLATGNQLYKKIFQPPAVRVQQVNTL